MGEWCSTAIVPRDQRGRRRPRPRRLVHEQTLQQRAPVGKVCLATRVLLHVPHACNMGVAGVSNTAVTTRTLQNAPLAHVLNDLLGSGVSLIMSPSVAW